MLSIRLAGEQDRENWDAYARNHPQVTPYHLFSWQAAVKSAYGHEPYYYLAESDQNLVGILPLIVMNGLFMNKQAVSLPFCDLGAALADTEEVADALKQYAANELPSAANHIEFRESARDITDPSIDLNNRKVRMVLPLACDSSELFAAFKSKLRSQIKKSIKNGLNTEIGHPIQNPCLLAHFYKVFSVNMHQLGSPVHSREWFEAIARNYAENCVMSIVYLDDKPIAGGVVLTANGKASIPWASTIQDYNRLSPNMLLYWSLLEYCCDHGIAEFDFGRSTYGEGTFNFKAQWGAKPKLLDWQPGSQKMTNHVSGNSGIKQTLRNIAETAWRCLPIIVANFIGPKIRKYISL